MKKNMSIADRTIRIIVATTFLLLYSMVLVTGVGGTILVIPPVAFILTFLIGFCPLYYPQKVSAK